MKKRSFILLFILIQLFISKSYAQLWFITRGLPNQDERAWGVDTDSSGNIYWAVEEKNPWPYWYFDIFLYKINSDSNQIWQSSSWGSTFNDIAFITKVKGNNVYLAGRSDASPEIDGRGGNALVLNYNTDNGYFNWQYIWDQGFGYEEIDGLTVQPDGIYLSGWTKGQTSDLDFLVQKINSLGQRIWSNTWDYNNLGKFDGANGQMAMDDNFVYAAGHVNRTNIASLNGDGALVCFSRNNGEYQWHVTWGGALYDDALGLTMSADSMLYVVGYTGSFGKGSQIYLNKYSCKGQLIWNRIWGGNNAEDARAVVADGDSIIYVAGATSSYGHGSGDYDIFILKYDSDGTLIDSLFWGGAYNETTHDVAIYSDYLYITGETYSFGNARLDGHHAEGLLLKVNGRTMQSPDTTVTNVVSTYSPIPIYYLYQNYPNPFNTNTTIEYSIPENNFVTLKIYDILGREITALVNEEKLAGNYFLKFDGDKFPNGVYFYTLRTNKYSDSKKFVLLK
jgi:hypothetical protein